MPSDAADAFLRAVIESPDDDLCRLVYADWLDEHGEPERAQFIRVQVEYDRHLDPYEHAPHGEALRSRWVGLLSENCTRWFWRPKNGRAVIHAGPLPAIRVEHHSPTQFETRQTFRGGFIAELTLTAADWLDHAHALLAACPIRNAKDGVVRLTTWPDIEEDIFHAPELYRWRLNGGRRWWKFWRRDEEIIMPSCGEIVANLLAAEWPGVRFELPQPIVTGRFSDGRPIYLDTRRTIRAMEAMHDLTREGDRP